MILLGIKTRQNPIPKAGKGVFRTNWQAEVEARLNNSSETRMFLGEGWTESEAVGVAILAASRTKVIDPNQGRTARSQT